MLCGFCCITLVTVIYGSLVWFLKNNVVAPAARYRTPCVTLGCPPRARGAVRTRPERSVQVVLTSPRLLPTSDRVTVSPPSRKLVNCLLQTETMAGTTGAVPTALIIAVCPWSSRSTRSARPAPGPSARRRWRSAARTCAGRPPSCCPSRDRSREGAAPCGTRGSGRVG